MNEHHELTGLKELAIGGISDTMNLNEIKLAVVPTRLDLFWFKRLQTYFVNVMSTSRFGNFFHQHFMIDELDFLAMVFKGTSSLLRAQLN